uniref:Peptidase_M1_N domain-containing protein n=1 Tax=Parastrongyloides trichosuri TaxID=131310 RepID=A0A0N4Z7Q8_PARTI
MNAWLKYSDFVCFFKRCNFKRYYTMMNILIVLIISFYIGKSIYSDVNKNIRIWNHYTSIEPRTTLSYTRLSKVAKPIHYKILLRPNLVTYEFSGDETITIFVEETTSVICVNSLNLTIDSMYAKRCGNEEYNDLRFEYLLDIEQIKIKFPEVLYKESIDLRIKFHGKLSKDPFGFYLSFYHENPVHPDQKVLASTQFESSYGRAAFPCFDEPNFKGTFEISLQVHKDLTALSNAEIKGIDKMDDGTKKVNYESTLHMSTYLVAFVVGDLEYIEGITSNGKTRIRVYSVKGQIHRADFGLKVGIETVNYLNVYFNIDYP